MRFILIFFFLLSLEVFANDGAFYAAGNHLIPIQETSISVKKEILSLKKVNNDFIDVSVNYEFFNPGSEKTIIVGFEAGSPMGDVDSRPKNGQHPYIYDFTVMLNGGFLKYEVAYVDDSMYARNGEVKSKNLNHLVNKSANMDYMDFGYVYHFKANFKTGKNTIHHTYRMHMSNSVEAEYRVNYILTAAKRWANKQIDDFTLILDMGNFESYNLAQSFFSGMGGWTLTGIGRMKDSIFNDYTLEPVKMLRFHIRNGIAIYQKRDFKPDGEIELFAGKDFSVGQDGQYLAFAIHPYSERIVDTQDEFLRKVFRNIPFARRGYIFQTADLQTFFSKIDWYMPDPNYQPDMDMLDEREKKWIMRWK